MNNVQAAITAERMRVSLERFLLMAPTIIKTVLDIRSFVSTSTYRKYIERGRRITKKPMNGGKFFTQLLNFPLNITKQSPLGAQHRSCGLSLINHVINLQKNLFKFSTRSNQML